MEHDDKDAREKRTEGPDARETFGQRVARLMREKGFKSQAAFAKKVGVDRTRLNRLLKDHTDPHPHEIAWIAEALTQTTDVLLDGIELPERVRKAIDELAELARRVYAAERERDEATAKLAWAEERQAAERKEWGDERASYEKRIVEQQQEKDRVTQEARQALARQQAQALATSTQLALRQSEVVRVNDEVLANNAWLHARVQDLERQLAAAKSNAAGAAIGAGGLALLGGILLGASSRD